MSLKKYEPTWESLKSYSIPPWYQDAKFGIFIHWGIYSVPAFRNEWYSRNMYIQGSEEFKHHVKIYGPQNKFGYKDFIPKFRAEKFDPDAWAALFKKAGAKYVIPVAEHHDGFAMYNCSISKWNAAKMGPKRDIVGELSVAVRKHGMVFGLSSHRAEHWWFFDAGMKFNSDVKDSSYADFYGPAMPGPGSGTNDWQMMKIKDWTPRPNAKFLEDWLARCCELVDKYQPQIIYFDWWIEQTVFQPYLQRFAAYYYNQGLRWDRGAIICYKNEAFPEGRAVYDVERGQLAGIRKLHWQTDTSVSKNSWCNVKDQDYKNSEDIIKDLVDIVSKNGNLLLNIGPRSDGTIPEEEQEILSDIGEWLNVNGEAIYGTHPWEIFGEGPTEVLEGGFTDTKRVPFTAKDIRFTTKEKMLYVICLDWPSGKEVSINSLGADSSLGGGKISNISMLGLKGNLPWSQDKKGLKIKIPTEKPCQCAYTFKVVFK